MRRFKWIEWNLQKISAHHLSAEEVEAAFDRVYQLVERGDGSFQMFAEIPSGRRIWVIWRYDREDEPVPDVFGETEDAAVFVITALLLRESIMPPTQPDLRSERRKLLDDQIAGEPQLPPPDLPADAAPMPVEQHLRRHRRRPLAVMGVVENGLVRPLDPHVRLPERAQVIIVAQEPV
jgi:hypothetical protein